MKSAINWFEVPVTDFERARRFYSNILTVELRVEQMDGAKMAFFPMDPKGETGGAIVQGTGYKPCRDGVLIYLNGGEDLAPILSRVEANGGKVLTKKTLITPEIGFMATFEDTEGNRIALHSQK